MEKRLLVFTIELCCQNDANLYAYLIQLAAPILMIERVILIISFESVNFFLCSSILFLSTIGVITYQQCLI